MAVTDIAVERKYAALQGLQNLQEARGGYAPTITALRRAAAYYWSPRAIALNGVASQSFPADALTRRTDLLEPVQWWYLDHLNAWADLPLGEPGSLLEALLIDTTTKPEQILITGFEEYRTEAGTLIPLPAPTWTASWRFTEPWSRAVYGAMEITGGQLHQQQEERLSDVLTFIASAFCWLRSKIVHVERAALQRHTRKRLGLAVDHADTTPLVITLRASETPPPEPGQPGHVEWTCRWAVRGHWRNQAVADGHRPVFVDSYVKGPEDKPFRAHTDVRYKVDR